jgi:hypothetical protein
VNLYHQRRPTRGDKNDTEREPKTAIEIGRKNMETEYKMKFETDETLDKKPRNRTSFIVTQQRLCDAKKILNDLRINWEVDLNKINLRDLRDSDFDYIKIYSPKIETRKIEIWYDGNEGDPKDIFHPENIDIVLDLIEFVQTGKKVIPPITVIPIHIIDGEKTSFNPVILDGLHRIRLARYLGETEVPLIAYEYTRKYLFTKAKWTIKRSTDKYKVSSLKGYKVYTFKISEWKLEADEIGNFVLSR